MKYIITEKQLRLIEDLELKSRAGDQEKQREEYINELLNKKVDNKNLLTLYNILKLKGLKVGLTNIHTNDEIRLEKNKNDTIFIRNNVTFGYDEKISLSHFSNGNIKRYYDIYYSEIKTYKDLLEEIEKFLIRENIKLKENLNLKSRAPQQEKQREEFVNNILKKGFENLTGGDLENIQKLDTEKTEEILKQICDNLKEFEPEIKKYDLISYYFWKIYFNNIKPKKYKDFKSENFLHITDKSAISYDDTYFYFFEYWLSENNKRREQKRVIVETKIFEFKTIKELIKYIKEHNEPEIQ